MIQMFKDKKSTTLVLILLPFFAVLFKFIIAGLTLPGIGHAPEMGAGEFGAAIMLILAPYIAREHSVRSTNAKA